MHLIDIPGILWGDQALAVLNGEPYDPFYRREVEPLSAVCKRDADAIAYKFFSLAPAVLPRSQGDSPGSVEASGRGFSSDA